MTFIHGLVEHTIPTLAPKRSVLQEWVERIPLRQQGVLLLALRGPDGTRKESNAKVILRNMRGVVMNSGREGKPMDIPSSFQGDTFMRTVECADTDLWTRAVDTFLSDTDEFNIHFFQHLMHAGAVVGLHHWHEVVAPNWWYFYEACVNQLHCNPETREQLTRRLRDGVRAEHDE